MSRRRPADNSATVSLFPFLAVLLCTMGALLVVLVAVSRAARESALRESAAQQQPAAIEPDPELRRELEKIDQHNARVKQLRSQAEQQLREDQTRLGHLENHMRRLQNQLEVLQAAAAELVALEEEHYDDREQAEREIARLQQLVEETRAAVDALKQQMQSRKRSYALIPYEGPHGTFRRPLYIECHKNELILQPEGVRISKVDLYPPFGAGNPLASALRAARNYYVQLRAAEGQSRDTEPYPLLVVRPDGLVMYDRARRAIESSDFDFGFELVEADWELKYPVADPNLASLEQHAIDQARVRQQALAAAAPRAYRHPALAAAGQFESEDGSEMGFGDSEMGGEGDGFSGDLSGGGSASDQSWSGTSQQTDSYHGGGDGPHSPTNETAANAADSTNSAGAEEQATDAMTLQPNGTAPAADAASSTAMSNTNSSTAANGAGGRSTDEADSGNQVVVSRGGASHEPETAPPLNSQTARGRDWALERKKASAVPVRRTIQVVIRGDQIVILDDNAKVDQIGSAGKRIPIQGETVESLDKLVAAVRDHIEGWGIAGAGLYWRPVLILNIGPEGERRADDLNRLLKNSGIELRVAEFLNNSSQERSGATRSR